MRNISFAITDMEIIMSYKVYLSEPIHPAAKRMLEEKAEIISDETQLFQVDAAINRNLNMNRSWLDRCPNLKVIGIHGTGTDGVDLTAANEKGIRVVYAPGENAQSVAELIAGLALSLARRLPQLDRSIQAGEVCTVGGAVPGMELQGKTFGTIGCGRIAQSAARIFCQGFGMHAIGYSPSLTPERAEAIGISKCDSPREVFRQADIISISVPLTDSTRGMVTKELLSQAKPGSILINTSRGGIVDERALYEALVSGPLAAAASDVFAHEPPTLENPLCTLPNFLAAPHIGANTDEALYRVSTRTVSQVLAVLDGTPLPDTRWVVR